jgi:glycosyltransferase involved in cell wall biosynthesis
MSVSVVITCHNDERTIEKAVRSVATQTAFDRVLEILVVDDGSNDGSRTLLEDLAPKVAKLRILETPNVGAAGARNAGLREARGLFVALLDGDDYWASEKLTLQLPAFSRGNNIGLVYGDFIDFSRDDAADGRIITVRRFDHTSPHQLRDYFLHDGPIMPSTAILRRAVIKDVGLFNESLLICEDTEFCLRVAEKWRFCHVSGALTFKRRHPGRISSRVDGFLPNNAVLTQEVSARHPELRRFAGRRMARGHVKASIDCKLKREWRRAVRHGITAIRLAPLYWRAWANLFLVLAPAAVVQPFYEGLKKPWHAVRHCWNSTCRSS